MRIISAIFFLILIQIGYGQDQYKRFDYSMNEFHLSKETIESKSEEIKNIFKERNYRIAGYKDSLLIIQLGSINPIYNSSIPQKSYQATEILYYDEKRREIIRKELLDTLKSKAFELSICNQRTIKLGYSPIPLGFEKIDISSYLNTNYFLDFWSEYGNIKQNFSKIIAEYKLDPITYFYDNTCNNFLISQYCANTYRCSEADSLIFIYNLNNIEKGNATPLTLSCVYCLNPQIIGDTIYYSQGFINDKETGNLGYHIYKSPLNNLKQKELIAENVMLRLIDSDGHYIFGYKSIRNVKSYVLIDARTKRFDYLIGRDFFNKGTKVFYSKVKNQFVVDYGDYFIYINVPDKFLLNSIGRDAKDIYNKELEEKIKLMMHKELK